jgi:hypothetical protein
MIIKEKRGKRAQVSRYECVFPGTKRWQRLSTEARLLTYSAVGEVAYPTRRFHTTSREKFQTAKFVCYGLETPLKSKSKSRKQETVARSGAIGPKDSEQFHSAITRSLSFSQLTLSPVYMLITFRAGALTSHFPG